jgi:hypothetical protein
LLKRLDAIRHLELTFFKIKVKPNDDEYTVSKSLICKESSYFAAMFKGEVTEGQTQTAGMKEMGGVVSSQSIVESDSIQPTPANN